MKKIFLYIFLFCSLFYFPSIALAEEKPSASREELLKDASVGLHKDNAIELKALEIRAKIYEPQVVYILDRSRIDIDIREEPIRFSPRIEIPLTQNRLE